MCAARGALCAHPQHDIGHVAPTWPLLSLGLGNWGLGVATELCRVDDGLPARMDGLELSKSRHRIERLKALGNSIVPQVAIEIFKAIKSAEELNAAKPKGGD